MKKKNVLFVCTQNKLRSPTAEKIFSESSDFNVLSAGTATDATNQLDEKMIEWADYIFVMEQHHRTKIRKKYKAFIKAKNIVSLGIPDEYEYMDTELIELIKMRVSIFFK